MKKELRNSINKKSVREWLQSYREKLLQKDLDSCAEVLKGAEFLMKVGFSEENFASLKDLMIQNFYHNHKIFDSLFRVAEWLFSQNQPVESIYVVGIQIIGQHSLQEKIIQSNYFAQIIQCISSDTVILH